MDTQTDRQTERHDEGRKFTNALNRDILPKTPSLSMKWAAWESLLHTLYYTSLYTTFTTLLYCCTWNVTPLDKYWQYNQQKRKKGKLKYKFDLREFLCISVFSSSFSMYSFKYESFYTYPTTFLISSEPISLSCSFWHSSRVIGPEGRRRVAIKQNRLADLMIPGATWQQIFSPILHIIAVISFS